MNNDNDKNNSNDSDDVLMETTSTNPENEEIKGSDKVNDTKETRHTGTKPAKESPGMKSGNDEENDNTKESAATTATNSTKEKEEESREADDVKKEKEEEAKMTIREKYDLLERRFGIESYYSHSKREKDEDDGFAAVLKARYSDFVVHEVGLDGTMAKLKTIQYQGDKVDSDIHNSDNDKDKQQQDYEMKDANDAGGKKRDASELSESTDSEKATDMKADESQKKNDEEPDAKKLKPSEEQSKEETSAAKNEESDSNEEQIKQARKELAKYVGEDEAQKSISLLLYWENKEEDKKQRIQTLQQTPPQEPGPNNKTPPKIISSSEKKEKYYVLPPISDKSKRKEVHLLLKTPNTFFSNVILADTVEGGKVRLWHKRFYRDMPNNIDRQGGRGGRGGGRGGGRNKRKEWPKERPNYLRFVLYKENIDTSTAARDIIRFARLNPPNFNRGGRGGRGRGRGRNQQDRVTTINYAGMKDKRGITTQYCTVYRKEPSDLLVINGASNHKNGGGCGSSSKNGACLLKVGHFEYVEEELKLGMLSGNRFDIVLRNVDIGKQKLQKWFPSSLEESKEVEEGKKIMKTIEHIQKIATSFQTYGFVNYFGMQRFGKYYDTCEVGLAVLKGDFESAVDIIMRPKEEDYEEEQRGKNLKQEEKYGCGDRGGKGRRQDYNVGNARICWSKRFANVAKPENDDKKKEDLLKDAERKCAREILPRLGRFMVCEVSIISHLSRKPRDYKGAFSCISKNLRLMFLHSYQSLLWNKAASRRMMAVSEENDKDAATTAAAATDDVRVGDLVLIANKSKEEGGSGTSGLKGKKVKVLDKEDVASQKYSIADVVLPLAGCKIEFPQNGIGEYFNAMLKEDGLTKDSFDNIKDRELALGGDYRKLICRPSDVDFEIKQYHDPLQPLLQTDLMEVHDVPVPPAITDEQNAINNKYSGNNDDDCDGNGKSNEEEATKKPALLGMVIGFTLPPSSYATIALRELMKRPTAREYQRELLLEGCCEGKMGVM